MTLSAPILKGVTLKDWYFAQILLTCLYWFIGEIRDVPLMLYVPLLTPCLDSEKLCIAVDLMKGTFIVSLAQKGLVVSIYINYGVQFNNTVHEIFFVNIECTDCLTFNIFLELIYSYEWFHNWHLCYLSSVSKFYCSIQLQHLSVICAIL